MSCLARVMRKARNDKGFTMGEVLIAIIIFVAAVLGISGMLVYGGSLFTNSASANVAAQLATQKLESVKSMPFYVQWDQERGNQDIDDYYYDPNKTNENQNTGTIRDNPNTDTPKTGYTRTISIQFVRVETYTEGGVQKKRLTPAVMNGNWVPSKTPDLNEEKFDRPKGGADSSADDSIDAVVLQVKVTYQEDGRNKVLVQRALASSVTGPGGALNPLMVVKSIKTTVADGVNVNRTNLAFGYLGEIVTVEVEVDTLGTMTTADNVEVQLWRTGFADKLTGTSTTIQTPGGYDKITCSFNLRSPMPNPAIYNVSVYWKTRGFMDDSYRDCFEVMPRTPVVDTVTTYGGEAAWGYKGQSQRTLYFTGHNFWGISMARLLRSDGTLLAETGSATLTDPTNGTAAQADFNLSSVGDSAALVVVVVTSAGTHEYPSDPNADGGKAAFDSNPKPTISSIALDTPNSYTWGYRGLTGRRPVKIVGTNLYGIGSSPGASQLTYTGKPACSGILSSAENTRTSGNTLVKSSVAYVTVQYDLSGTATDRPNGTSWDISLTNGGNQPAGKNTVFSMNPAPDVTAETIPGSRTTGATYTGDNVEGNYFQTQPTSIEMFMVKGNTTPIPTNTPYMKLSGGTFSETGLTTKMGNLTMNLRFQDSAFLKWNASGTVDPPSVAEGTYYLYVRNADGQAEMTGNTMTISRGQFTINVSASPTAGGTVGGGGTFSDYDQCTVTATRNSSYWFIKWTEGGAQVSPSSSYTFMVTANRNLVAQFRVMRVYWDGTEYVPINSGYTGDGGDTTRDKVGPSSGYLHLKAQASWVTTRQIAWSTDSPIDLTGVTRIGVEWRNTSSDNDSHNESYLVASPSSGGKAEDSENNGARLSKTGAFGTRIDYLQLNGSITDSRYIRVHARGIYDWVGYKSEIYVTKIWIEPSGQYQVNVNANPSNGGTVSGGGLYEEGASVTVTAAPYAHWHFLNWTEGGVFVSSDPSYTFNIAGNRDLQANFALDTHTISLSASPSNGGTVSGGGTFNDETSITVSATATTYWKFVYWEEGGSTVSTNPNYTFTVTGDRTLVAHFRNQFTISVTANPPSYGSVSGGAVYTGGATCTVVATAGAAYTFVKWTEGGTTVSTNTSYSFTVVDDRNLVANFRVKRVYWDGTENVPINSGYTGDGNTDRSKGGGAYLYLHAYDWWLYCQISWSTDVPVDLTGVSRIGIQWRNTDSNDSSNESYLVAATNSSDLQENQGTKFERTGSFGTRIDYLDVSGINASRYIRVHARESGALSSVGSTVYVYKIWLEPPNHYEITTSTSTVGGGTGGYTSGDGIYESGLACTVTATPYAGCQFTNWTEGGNVVSSSASYQFTVSNARDLVANFIHRWTISVSQITLPSGTGGTVSGGGTFNHNDSCTVIATPSGGYNFINWTEGATVVSSSTSYTFTVTASRTLVANFKKTYTVAVSASPASGGTASGAGTFNYNDSVTVTATAAQYSTFVNWTEGGVGQSTSTSYTFNITANRTLVANFNNQYAITLSSNNTQWGTVSGGGTFTGGNMCTAVAALTSRSGAAFLGWYEGATQVSTSLSYAFTVTTPRTLVAKFRLWIYNGDSTTPNYAGFTTGYTANSGHYEAPNYTLAGQNRYVLRLHSWSDYHLFGATHRGAVACTALVNFTGASTINIYWSQPKTNIVGTHYTAAYCQGAQMGNEDDGRLSGSSDNGWSGYKSSSHNVTGWGTGWFHCNAQTDYVLAGSNDTDVRIQYIYLDGP